jgi:hypothetical protein
MSRTPNRSRTRATIVATPSGVVASAATNPSCGAVRGSEDLRAGGAQPGDDRRAGTAARAGNQRPPPPQFAADDVAHTAIVRARAGRESTIGVSPRARVHTGVVPTLLSIGEFAQLTHLSIRTLRRYHDTGLLAPARVDDATGYRYYQAEQIPAAQVIHRLRELDLCNRCPGGIWA